MWTRVDLKAPSARADFIRVWINELYYGDKKQNVEGYLFLERDNIKSYCCLGIAEVETTHKAFRLRHNTDAYTYCFGVKKDNNCLTSSLSAFLGMERFGKFISDEKENIRDYVIKLNGLQHYKGGMTKQRIKSLKHQFASLSVMNDNGISFPIIALIIRKFAISLFKDLSKEEQKYIEDTKLDGNHQEKDNG